MQRRFKKIIQIELNELSEELIRSNAARGRLPNFSKILSEWQHTHTTSEKNYEHLEPWIQWVTAHTGKKFAQHQIFHLGDAGNLKFDQVWELLSDEKLESGIVGCMNAVRGRAKGGVFFPDPWSKNGETYPPKLQEAWNFISRRVQSHAVSSGRNYPFSVGIKTLLDLKVPPRLMMKIGTQLVRQKLAPSKKWPLAAIFDEFLFSFFDDMLGSTNFAFNALFLNSMAHYQHHYWRQHEPELFNSEVKCPDCGPVDDPVLFGLQTYDRILKKVIEKYSADPSVLVLICTGLGQIPYRQDESQGGMNYYRLKDHRKFAERVGISSLEIFPMMSRDWQVSSSSRESLEDAFRKLSGLTVNGQKLLRINKNSETSYFLETAIVHGIPKTMEIFDHLGRSIGPFFEWFGSIAVKSGCHSGQGSLWCSQPILTLEQVPKMCLTQLSKISLYNFGVPDETSSRTEPTAVSSS